MTGVSHVKGENMKTPRKIQKQSPKQSQKIQRQTEAFVDAAYLLFREKGVANTTMSEVASHVGFSAKTLFQYFASKQLLALAIIERYNDEALIRLEKHLKKDVTDPVDYVLGFIDSHLLYDVTMRDIYMWRELEAYRITINNNKDIDKREFIILTKLQHYYDMMAFKLISLGIIGKDVSVSAFAQLIHALVAYSYNKTIFNAYRNADEARAELRFLLDELFKAYRNLAGMSNPS